MTSVDAGDPKKPRIEIKAGKPLKDPVTLASMKSNKLFKDSPLLKQSPRASAAARITAARSRPGVMSAGPFKPMMRTSEVIR